jgi:hypothetical protein
VIRALGALLLCAAAAPPVCLAHETITTKLTWTRDIQRIFIRRCMGCHQAGGTAFSLASWKDARPWAVAIREEVTTRRMPPVSTVKGFGSLKGDGALTQEEIQWITDWANGGAPEGDPRLESDELPRLWQAGPSAEGRRLRVRGERRLDEAMRLTGIDLARLPGGATIQAVLARPDGSVEPLVWIRAFRREWAKPVVFLDAVDAPAGSRVVVLGTPDAELEVAARPAPAGVTPRVR